MAEPDFETRVTRGLAQWFTQFEHDVENYRVRIGLTHDPERGQTQGAVEFSTVETVSSDWFECDKRCMERLIGAHKLPLGSLFRYTLVTDQREIEIVSHHEARVDNWSA